MGSLGVALKVDTGVAPSRRLSHSPPTPDVSPNHLLWSPRTWGPAPTAYLMGSDLPGPPLCWGDPQIIRHLLGGVRAPPGPAPGGHRAAFVRRAQARRSLAPLESLSGGRALTAHSNKK